MQGWGSRNATCEYRILDEMHAYRTCIFSFRYCIHKSTANTLISSESRVRYTKASGMQWFRRWRSYQRASTPTQPQSHIPLIMNHGISTVDCDEESLYHYTSGQWPWNEKDQLSRHYSRFNLTELVRVAIQVTGSNSSIQVQKLRREASAKSFSSRWTMAKRSLQNFPTQMLGPSTLPQLARSLRWTM